MGRGYPKTFRSPSHSGASPVISRERSGEGSAFYALLNLVPLPIYGKGSGLGRRTGLVLSRARYARLRLGLSLLAFPRTRHRAVADRIAGPPPVHQRRDPVLPHPILVALGLVEHRIDQRLREQPRLEPEIDQLGMLGVVVV